MRQTIRSHPWWTALVVVIVLNIALVIAIGALMEHKTTHPRTRVVTT